MKRRPILVWSDRRIEETRLYRFRIRQFLLRHPYCQVWLSENGVAEEEAIAVGGVVIVGGVEWVVPLATQVHHRNKRRGCDLLDEREWLAVSRALHERIERHKDWARSRGYLAAF